MDPISVSSATALHYDMLRQAEHMAPPLPPAAPDVVSRFEALMARAPEPGIDSISNTSAMQSAVAGVEGHLKHHADAVERVMSLTDSNMSAAEMQARQTQATMELGLLSMQHAAYMEVMGSTKSTVSALMKNQ